MGMLQPSSGACLLLLATVRSTAAAPVGPRPPATSLARARARAAGRILYVRLHHCDLKSDVDG